MNLRKCILTKNACYITGTSMVPKGVMVHSTGANNPYLNRYVQPDDGKLGENAYRNHWNTYHPGNRKVCVHAFIGKLADGSIATYQTLPFDMRGWHAGGSANNTHIGFEICEDSLHDKFYFDKVYKEAVEFTAYLCKKFSLNPKEDGVIICHNEGYDRRVASNHSDVMHWFPKHGKSMDSFRNDVIALMSSEENNTEGEEELVTLYKHLSDVPEAYRPSIEKVMKKGALKGYSDTNPNSLEDNVLNVSEDFCRTMTVLDNLGVLD